MARRITEADVRNYLATFPVFRQPEQQGYLLTAVDRFTHTLNLIPRLPNPENVRLLEIGGRPFFMSVLMQHFFGYDVHLANEPTAVPGEDGEFIELKNDQGVIHRFPQRRLNIEYDEWPWEDGFFDVVVYCEVIEHLVYDPTHTLVEAHRTLKNDTGTLLLSTPNALCYTYLLDMLRGHNPYPPYDGYSHYARHHRLFSPSELAYLCREVGYSVEKSYSAYDTAYSHPRRIDPLIRFLVKRGRLSHRLDVIYLLAHPHGEPRYAYPSSLPFPLYQDVHGYNRITASRLAMFDNLPQFGGGLYPLENWGGGVRWTAEIGRVYLHRTDQAEIEVAYGPSGRPAGTTVTGYVEIASEAETVRHPFAIPGDQSGVERFALPAGAGKLNVTIGVDRPWSPRETDPHSADSRVLGIVLREIALV